MVTGEKIQQGFAAFIDRSGDRFIIDRDRAHTSYTLQKEKAHVSTELLPNAPIEKWVAWFAERASAVIDGKLQTEEISVDPAKESDFRATVAYGGSAIDLRVERRVMLNGKDRLIVTFLAAHPIEELLTAVCLEGISRTLFDSWRNSDKVLIVGSATKPFTRRFLLSLCDADEITALSEASHTTGRTFFLSPHTDPIDCAQSIPSDVCNNIIGSLVILAVPKICGACSKVNIVDAASAHVPQLLQNHFRTAEYRVGRGCVACGYHGTEGIAVVTSACTVSTPRAATVDVAAAWADGTRPLIHDAYEKASHGKISLEGVAKAGVTVPPHYHSCYASPDTEKPSEKPLSGADAFRGKATAQLRRSKPLVLVVEDDPDQRAILEMVFKSADYEVEAVANGHHALTHVRNAVPDIIVSDLMMPEIDGEQLIKQLRANPLSRNIPVLILTVLTDTNREFDLLSLGADDYCEKTIQRKILLKRVENLLRRNRTIDAST